MIAKAETLTLGRHEQLRMPAEWEPHAATWLTWPHNPTDWPGKMRVVQGVYAEVVQKLAATEPVCIIVQSSAHEKRVRTMLRHVMVDEARVHFYRMPTDRSWIRDYGPLFSFRDAAHQVVATDFAFNGWARYPSHHQDNALTTRLASRLEIARVPVTEQRSVVLEGGSIDHNGQGTLVTTEECLLDPAHRPRNPWMGRTELEATLGTYLGAGKVIWLAGGILGDVAYGHVDDVCRFTDPTTLVYAVEENPKDVNYAVLRQNQERLRDARLADGSRPRLVALPMPGPAYYDGQRLPASYTNFYIANETVLVPTFNDEADVEALSTLRELFPGRRVVGIHALDLVWGMGGLHSIALQQPCLPRGGRTLEIPLSKPE